jgi:hypothetical protein
MELPFELSHRPTRTLAESGTAPVEENKILTFIYLHSYTYIITLLSHRLGRWDTEAGHSLLSP